MGLERWHWDPHSFGLCSVYLYPEYIPKIRSVKITEFESKIRSAQPSGARHIVLRATQLFSSWRIQS
jgi:hypothetical protein